MKKNSNLPLVSFLVPTLNSERTLEKCLASIDSQDYPKEKLEIIIADGGSTDNTLSIIRKFEIRNSKFEIRILDNPLKTGEAGKAVALKHAQGELVALIDSDNILADKNWLKRMVEPFSDPEIIGAEPWEFIWRSQDGFIDRYCALLGMNDPLCLFLGNYDKKSVLTGRWTDLPVEEKDKGGWIKVTLRNSAIPTIGANGTIFRTIHLRGGGAPPSAGRHLGGARASDYLVDIDIIASLAANNPVKIAKVKLGIVHLYCGSSLKTFIRKQKRRISDYLYYQKLGARSYPWRKQNKLGLFKFILSCVTILPLLFQSLKGYFKKPDPAWFFHPLACWLTLGVYTLGTIRSLVKSKC